MDFFHGGTDTLLLLLVGALAWFFQRKLEGYDKKHNAHFKHATDMSLHETDREREAHKDERDALADQLKLHTMSDDRRFDRFDAKMDVIGEDIKNILRVVSR